MFKLKENIELFSQSTIESELLLKALTVHNPGDEKKDKKDTNEELEYLGDKILKACMGSYIFNRFRKDEGFYSELQSHIESTAMLGQLGRSIGIPDALIISPEIDALKIYDNSLGRNSDKFIEDAFEAIFGALFQSSGFEACNKYWTYIADNFINFPEIIVNDTNYKDMVEKYFKQRLKINENIIYKKIPYSAPGKHKICLKLSEKHIIKIQERYPNYPSSKDTFTGIGRKAKDAEKESCKEFVKYFYALFEKSAQKQTF